LPASSYGALVTEALKTEGFAILTVVDVQATMKAKLGIDGRPYGSGVPAIRRCPTGRRRTSRISARCCRATWSSREEADGRLVVGFMDPVAVLQMTSNPEVGSIAREVRAKLERVRSILIAHCAGAAQA
jgi:hypothetical protein